MRSVRLGVQIESELEQAARVSGTSASDLIREGVRERCSRILRARTSDAWSAYVGSVNVGGDARQSSREYGDDLEASHARRSARPGPRKRRR